MAPLGIKGKLKRQSEVVKMKHQVLRKSISGRVLPGLPPQKLTAIFGVPSRPVTRPEMYRYTLNILLILPFLFILGLLTTHDTSALSYQSNTGVQFTINPTITLSVSGDLIINDLTPGNSSDSNIITVTASSNAVAGYGLYSTVGSSSNPSTELRKDGTDTTNKFSSITTNKTSLSDFNGSDWGYSYSTDSGTTWISGDITETTLSGYNGLPLYTTESPIKLINTTTSGSSSVQFKIGAKASNSQIAGDYTNTINFIGVAKANPVIPTYIQDLTLAQCQKNVGINGNPENVGDELTVVDKRDNNTYTVRYINGACWMTQNLNYDYNTTPTSGGCPTKKRGCYYAWGNALDICPVTWSLPAKTDFENLISIYDTDSKLTASPFLGIHGGYYDDYYKIFRLVGTYGLYWSSTPDDNDTTKAWGLRFYDGTVDIEDTVKKNPRPVRCMLSS